MYKSIPEEMMYENFIKMVFEATNSELYFVENYVTLYYDLTCNRRRIEADLHRTELIYKYYLEFKGELY